MDEDGFYAYVIMEALGLGTYEPVGQESHEDWRWPGHGDVLNCVPAIARKTFVMTEEHDDDKDWGLDTQFPSTKWVAQMNKEEWDAFREHMNIEPDRCNDTLGMLTDFGPMWALCDESDGMDWNMGGVTPVSMVQTYFCCQDEDIMERADISD